MLHASRILIRPAGADDALAISELITQASLRFIVPELSDAGRELLLSHQTADAIRLAMERGTMYWLGESEEMLVGVVALIFTAERTHLYHLFVSADHHRRGIGRLLWQHVRQHCLDQGEDVSMTVNSSTFAQPFYRSLGFVPAGPTEEHEGVIFHPMRIESLTSG